MIPWDSITRNMSGALGIVGTCWNAAALGCGATEAEAYEDARESLAQRDWDVSSLPSASDAGMDAEEVAPQDSELWYYVAVYVRSDDTE